MENIPPPNERLNFVGHDESEALVASLFADNALSNGWMITGGVGIGKATFAYRIARALLAPSGASTRASHNEGLSHPVDNRTAALIANKAHPDLFIAERRWDEKKDRYETEITVETVRKLTAFLQKTASMGGWRVAIIDTADEMNKNAANALLKSLEEPPPNSVLLLLSSAPGQLPATVRSRCRTIGLRPANDDLVAKFLEDERAAQGEEARRIAKAARGRPGYALTLALEDGADAISIVDNFLSDALKAGDGSAAAQRLAGKAADQRWRLFKTLLIENLSDAARSRALNPENDEGGYFTDVSMEKILYAREEISTLAFRGDAVNLDRSQLVMAMARRLRSIVVAHNA